MELGLKEKYKNAQHKLVYKDPSLPPEKMLEVDSSQLKQAKDRELIQPMKVRFLEEGPDRTIDDSSKFPKQCVVEGMSGQETIFEMRRRVAEQEGIDIEDVNLYVRTTCFGNEQKIGDCFVDWMGFGLDEWPPRFIIKPRVKGFELFVDVPRMRDTSIWENGKLNSYWDKNMIFDVETSTTVLELKDLLAKKTNIPSNRQKLSAVLRPNVRELGELIDLDDNTKTLSDYGLDKTGVAVKFEKSQFDENGNYVFDDAFHDADGYHPQSADCWIPQDALADRSRPDAHKIDPSQPLSIVTDRRQAEATAKADAD